MFSKIKAIQDLKSQANTIKKALDEEMVEGQGAWGKIKIKMDGNQDVKSVEIADDILGDKNKLVKIVAWYDNEMGYSTRLVELIEKFL